MMYLRNDTTGQIVGQGTTLFDFTTTDHHVQVNMLDPWQQQGYASVMDSPPPPFKKGQTMGDGNTRVSLQAAFKEHGYTLF